MSFEWTDKYQIGDKAIDNDHRELFLIAHRLLRAADQESQRASASELRATTKAHLWQEELLMREVGYPLTETHLGLHSELIKRLVAFEENIDRGELFQSELVEFINFWFTIHIAMSDAPLVVYVRKHKGE
jgi:hemerythrin-like metal-binding protein